jgi:adenylate kinase
MKYRTILLFGAPGAGKGTQGKILGSVPGFFHFACGDAFRNMRIADPIARVFLDYSSRGQLVPDEPTIEFWHHSIERTIQQGVFRPDQDWLVLDGMPRNPRQAEIINDLLDVKAVFYFDIPDRAEVVRRIQRRALRENRLDDINLEVITRRLDAYESETAPVLAFYGSELVHKIDSLQPPVKVLHDIVTIVIGMHEVFAEDTGAD